MPQRSDLGAPNELFREISVLHSFIASEFRLTAVIVMKHYTCKETSPPSLLTWQNLPILFWGVETGLQITAS